MDPSLARYLPAHAMIRSQLLDLIEKGHWRPGERIDSENSVAARFKVSVGTVRKAMSDLVAEGVLVRRQGSGTYVRRTQIAESQVRYYQFLKAPGDAIAGISLRLLSVGAVKDGPWRMHLGSDRAGYVRIRRVVIVGERPCVYTESFLPASRFGDLLAAPVADISAVPLYKYLEDKFGTPTLKNEHFLSVVRLPPAAVAHLKKPHGTVGGLWEFVSFALRDLRIEYRRSYLSEMPFRLRLGATEF